MEPQATYQLTFEILVLVGSTIAGVIASYKLLTDVVIAKKRKSREEYSLAKDYIQEIQQAQNTEKPSMHPLLVEQGYFAISGKLLHSHEILKFLDYPNPTISLRNYSLARSITKIDVATGELAYKGIYKFTVMRKILSVLFVTSYFLFALLSFTPLILGSYVGITSSISSLALTLGFLISFMIIAIVALLCFIKIQAANTLLEQQNLVHNTRDPK